MAKLTIIAVLVVAVVALAEASTYRTTITTTVIEEENPRGRQQCREQIQRQQLHHCQSYLSQGRSSELALRSFVNPQEQHLRQCCEQLQNIDEECRCEAIRQVVRQQQQGGGRGQDEEMQEVLQRARSLPRRCNMEPRECQIRAVFI